MLVDVFAAVVQSGCGRVVLVSGEAGIGKTSLVREFCDHAEGSGRVLWGACDVLFTPRPLGPLLDVAERTGGDLADVLGRVAAPYEVAAAVGRLLEKRPPTILVLEDVHWADEATLDVLRLLARRIDGIPALVIATYRDVGLDRRHPLRIVLGDITAVSPVERLHLAPLSRDAVTCLAAPHGAPADELYLKTGGNPFFVTEALAAADEQIPATVRDAVLGRAARLSTGARMLLDAIAVGGTQTELWLLETLASDCLEYLEECLTSGMLTSAPLGVAFRHELARLAVEESVPFSRKLDLHRKALAALADPPGDTRDLARLAHHAEVVGDVDAVLRFAPMAAASAASLGAHREAAAQYARALRFGDRLPTDERAELLEHRSRECYLTDQYDEGIAALEQALGCRRTLGDTLREGEALRRLSEFFWCPGRTAEAERAARDAVARLESLSPGRELAMAYVNLASLCGSADRMEEAIGWARRAVELAARLGDPEITSQSLALIAACQYDYEQLEQNLGRARREGHAEQVVNATHLLVSAAIERRRYSVADKYLEPGLAYCTERGLELYRLYLLAYRARLKLDQGHWAEAADSAAAVLRIPRTSTTPRIIALVVLALVRARRGDTEVWPLLDEAWMLAEPTGELLRLGPVATARAEAAWLAGRPEVIAAVTETTFELAIRHRSPWIAGELASWRQRGGVSEQMTQNVAEPYALELTGEGEAAARAWEALGCPYEAALALIAADDDAPLQRALSELQALGAQPAAGIVARKLRARGALNVPRGQRKATRANPANLTPREVEVLALLADGLHNSEIANRLFLAEKTVAHHVSAILRKLGVANRLQAVTEAQRLGMPSQQT